MRRGDRVVSTRGPGVVKQVTSRTVWGIGRPRRKVWLLVELDEGGTSYFSPEHLTREEGS